jgi:uncharacterized membrane-anchored protein YitT (DUF2179 family)
MKLWPKLKENTASRWAVYIGICLFTAAVRALSIHYFIVPNNFAPGGVTGISVMVQYLTGGRINSGYIIIALNIPLTFLAYKFISQTFAVLSLIGTVFTTVFLVIFQYAAPDFAYSGGDIGTAFLAAVAGGVIAGTGLAVMFKIGGSTGGTDIVAALIQKKYNSTNVAWFILVIDVIIALISGVVFSIPIAGSPAPAASPVTPILLAISGMFVTSKVAATISHGMIAASKCEIITHEPEVLAKIIMEKMKRGVTVVPAKGMRTGGDFGLLIVIVRNRQLPLFKQLIKEHAKEAFAYLTPASQVIGRGFTST